MHDHDASAHAEHGEQNEHAGHSDGHEMEEQGEGHGHGGHDHSSMVADFRRRFWVSNSGVGSGPKYAKISPPISCTGYDVSLILSLNRPPGCTFSSNG
jgi:hypothetical protein